MTDLLKSRHAGAHPVFRVELAQAAHSHGFRKDNDIADGWLWFKSDALPGTGPSAAA